MLRHLFAPIPFPDGAHAMRWLAPHGSFVRTGRPVVGAVLGDVRRSCGRGHMVGWIA
jgi:hypothetical protein